MNPAQELPPTVVHAARPAGLRRNIELKARLRDPVAASAIAEQLSGGPGRQETQTDTYFHCHHGRLKLREIEGHTAQLIWYQRDDLADAKSSDYRLTEIDAATDAAASLLQSLTAALGVRGVVKKRRQIYLHQNVRIHLDVVEGRGTFLEFEAVVSAADDELRSRQLLDELARRFDLGPSDWLGGSYGDQAELTSP
jgi:predicted adenylyl cyclase CyaB